MELDTEALDRLTAECKTPGDVEEIYSKMLQHMINSALAAEMMGHLGYEAHAKNEGKRSNVRNGMSRKRVQSAVGELEIETPWDRGRAASSPSG